jgi:predicted nucleic acid-binding protein
MAAEALAYFDTSVLIKRYVEESGSVHARRLMRRYRMLSSVIAPVEAVSAIARRYRAREVTRADFDAIVARMLADRQYWDLVELGARVAEGAERLILQRRSGPSTLCTSPLRCYSSWNPQSRRCPSLPPTRDNAKPRITPV